MARRPSATFEPVAPGDANGPDFVHFAYVDTPESTFGGALESLDEGVEVNIPVQQLPEGWLERVAGWTEAKASSADIFRPEQVYEVDCPGLTSPVLSNFNWTGLPRPVYPLDEETVWTPPSTV